MIQCKDCKSTFLSFKDDPGRDQRAYDDHVPYCSMKKNLKLKKKSKKREKEFPVDSKWEEFDV
jgi:hypothetical protein